MEGCPRHAAFADKHLHGSLFASMDGGKLAVVAGSYVEEDSSMLLVVENETQVEEAVRQLIRIGLDRVDAWIPAGEALSESRYAAIAAAFLASCGREVVLVDGSFEEIPAARMA